MTNTFFSKLTVFNIVIETVFDAYLYCDIWSLSLSIIHASALYAVFLDYFFSTLTAYEVPVSVLPDLDSCLRTN